MALKDIPVLPVEHPLYDWSDWQSSRNALVSGTPTRYFAKEAWNAIIDSLNEALAEAGLAWDEKYTTAEGAKITVAYGKLTAQKFNSVRHNIEWPAPLGWAWADREDFRGYVGREDFNGRITHGKACDKVYPEYIIELVRKLNLLLEIMRGTALIEDGAAEYISGLNLDVQVLSRRSVRAETEQKSAVNMISEARSCRAVTMEADMLVPVVTEAEVIIPKAAQVWAEHTVNVITKAEGSSKQVTGVEVDSMMLHSDVDAEIFPIPINKLVDLSASAPMGVNASATMDSWPVYPIEGGRHISNVNVLAEVEPGNPIDINSQHDSRSDTDISVELMNQTVSMSGESLIQSLATCEIGTDGWARPIWVNGGLWIRQAHTINRREDGSLEVI